MATSVAAWPTVALGEVIQQVSRLESVQPDKEYRLLGVRLDGNGPFLRETKLGSQTAATTLSQVRTGDFIYSRLFAWRGAFGTIDSQLDGCYVSGEFPTFRPDANRLDIEYLRYWFRLPTTLAAVEADCTGSTPLTRNRYKEQFFLALSIPLPSLDEQRRIVARIEALAARIAEARGLRQAAMAEAEALWLSTVELLLNAIPTSQRLGDVAEVICGQHLGPDEQADSGVPYITGPADFTDREANPSRFAAVIKSTCEPGDVLLTVKGAGVGKVNLAPAQRAVIGRQLYAIRPRCDALDQTFLWIVLQYRLTALRDAITATTVPGISRADVEPLGIPLPPLDTQRWFAGYLDGLNRQLAVLRRLLRESEVELEALLPAFLDKAFRGEL